MLVPAHELTSSPEMPKSHIFISPFLLIRIFDGLTSEEKNEHNFEPHGRISTSMDSYLCALYLVLTLSNVKLPVSEGGGGRREGGRGRERKRRRKGKRAKEEEREQVAWYLSNL